MSIQTIVDRLHSKAHLAARRGDRRAAQRGFSLIEVMIAMVVSAIVLVGVFAFSGVTSATTTQFTRGVKIQQGLEAAMNTMGNDIRLAGLGFAPMCNELRIFGSDTLTINPSRNPVGAGLNPVVDADTDEPYWVLRDGIQAHWRSSPENNGAPLDTKLVFPSQEATSALPMNAADSLDIALGEPGFVSSAGAFRLVSGPLGAATLMVEGPTQGPNAIDMGGGPDADAIAQLFPPGSFVMLMGANWTPNANDYDPVQSDCILMQVTQEIEPAGGANFHIPVDPWSKFNENPSVLSSGTETLSAGAVVVPLGRFRWSRYEIDYTVERQPFLVRTELISWRDTDPQITPTRQYPSCGADIGAGSVCKIPQLHLPAGTQGVVNSQVRAARVPIAPMIEDMQIAVGCDPIDYTGPLSDKDGPAPLQVEKGAREGLPSDNTPNRRVDEYARTNERNIDEWVGNSIAEVEAPDCVHWGTGEVQADYWPATGILSERFIDGGWRISPQVVRVTLLGKSEYRASGSMASDMDPTNEYNTLFSIEDRPAMAPAVPGREYRTLTETFRPKNLTYRDPHIP